MSRNRLTIGASDAYNGRMSRRDPSTDEELLILALLSAVTGFGAALAGNGITTGLSPAIGCWILLQCVATTMLVLAIVPFAGMSRLSPPRRAVKVLLLAFPVVMLLDGISFRWSGERLLSQATWRVFTKLRDPLLTFLTTQMIVDAALLIVGTIGWLIAATWLARRAARRLSQRKFSLTPVRLTTFALGAIALLLLPVLGSWERVRDAMAFNSSRHPLCVFRIAAFPSPHLHSELQNEQRTVEGATPAGARPWPVRRGDQLQRLVTTKPDPSSLSHPDILIVVIESFRHELLDRDTMPFLHDMATRGIYCRNHFSGGNATNHGMFSLFNGLEATWFQRPVTYSPVMNRLFRDAGYELGFFAGDTGWREFLMDGFIDKKHYDVFETEPRNGLASDRRATQRAAMFLDRRKRVAGETMRPRLAVLYLYATHATYQSYADDQVFQPAADERIRYPFESSTRDLVWNRYRNSARTVDRFLRSIANNDLVMLVTGDHGESFLEDGTIGHGTRISAYQNMTPAVLCAPGLSSRMIEELTHHVDLLPTILSLAGLSVSDDSVFDGENLLVDRPNTLSQRVFATRNYLDDVYGLVGPWSLIEEAPFAYRFTVSLSQSEAQLLNAVDREGNAIPSIDASAAVDARQLWLQQRFDLAPGIESKSGL